ncbi:MAG TPA: hypothetical protein PKG63_08925 [Bacteroidales bacterium]|jgi:hypothetical protein|nr:hypothetical protein [Bacteroidales bacterium]HNV96584.1 hypothetical protein [Bacteroidales bacterium]
MFKIIQFLFILFLFFRVNAQQSAIDFTLRDVWGIERNLYNALDSGKIVVLDFFITNCGTCQINTPKLDTIWNTLGHNGDSLWIWGIESSGRNDSEVIAFMQQYQASYPCFSTMNDTVVTTAYNITYTPQYMVVCPDKTMKQVGINNVTAAINGCKTLSYSLQSLNNVVTIQNKQISFPTNTRYWQLYTIHGILIENSTFSDKTISLSYLNNGLYIVKWYDGNNFYTQKLCLF